MAEMLTPQQRQAVENRGGKLLVSAAAGSGKTKVLVDRLMLYITQGQGSVNIDDFLIITYTKAAASELRGKIAAKLNEKIALDPENRYLQRQIQRLYLAKISTVHAYCADILREFAYQLDIPGDFRVADELECQVLQASVLEQLLENSYRNPGEEFLHFVDTQAFGRDDRTLPGIILQVYNSARCHMSPDSWLAKCLDSGNTQGLYDAGQTLWGTYLIARLHEYLDLQIGALTRCSELAEQSGIMDKPAMLLRSTVDQLQILRAAHTWDEITEHKDIDYGRLVFPKSCTDSELACQIKTVRRLCKDGLAKKLLPFTDHSERVLSDLNQCSQAVSGLINLVKSFSREYDAAKRSRRILDFGDLEHKMLDLLLGRARTGITRAAEEIGGRYVEIMVDEYQDSNAVQDAIFSALTQKRQNCFMVGDVKQSIYQFRLADPEIFLKKYNEYVMAGDALGSEGRKVMLSSNFRSASGVISAVNDVFSQTFSPNVGGLEYGEQEQLNEGIPHIPIDDREIEFRVISVQEDTYAEEAAYTAKRIRQLLDGNHMIRHDGALRPIVPEDIVILLRSPNSVGAEFVYALQCQNIQVNFGSGSDLLQTEEISFLRAMLQIISNPLQDIPLISALTSRVFCFTADDLAIIRSGYRRRTVYESLCQSMLPKAKEFIELLDKMREEAKFCTLSKLVQYIVRTTHLESIFASFEDGGVKCSNLQGFYRLVSDCEASNQKELDQFLDFLSTLEKKGLSAPEEGKLSGAVTIMSIHKSKGLEFPVVFLCGLSRDFNREDIRAQVLCNKDLGIGFTCVDLHNRVRYPSIAKKAIAEKILKDSLSEELRVLYVAMTRARDRLIMTYAVNHLEKDISELVHQMNLCPKEFITSEVSCPGTWVLMSALRRIESGQLFALGGRPDILYSSDTVWDVSVEEICQSVPTGDEEQQDAIDDDSEVCVEVLKESLGYTYPHQEATTFPSKRTATQLKGRNKDQEAAQNTDSLFHYSKVWRKPSFVAENSSSPTLYGNAVHTVMQYIHYDHCDSLQGVEQEIQRLTSQGFLTGEMADRMKPFAIWDFFQSDVGKMVRASKNVIREFKFSVLEDAAKFQLNAPDDRVLLQGVVDLAVIEPDGITVIDFKTDRVTDSTLSEITQRYTPQVLAYADALKQIYGLPVKSAQLFFFEISEFASVI